jgi:hypothetical protein
MKRSIGVDLHKSAFTVCYYESEEKHEFKTYQVNMKSLGFFKNTLKKPTSWLSNPPAIRRSLSGRYRIK